MVYIHIFNNIRLHKKNHIEILHLVFYKTEHRSLLHWKAGRWFGKKRRKKKKGKKNKGKKKEKLML